MTVDADATRESGMTNSANAWESRLAERLGVSTRDAPFSARRCARSIA